MGWAEDSLAFREKYQMPGNGTNYGQTIHLGIAEIGKNFIYPDKVVYEKNYLNYKSFGVTQKWFNKQCIIDYEQNTNYYISKILVFREKQLDSNRTWNLIRYNIVQ